MGKVIIKIKVMTEYKVEVTEFDTRWYNLKDELHREDGPAVEYLDGYKAYYINGKRHREDGPAIENENRGEAYYINDQYLTEQEFNNRTNPCINKVVEIDGVKYKLTKV
jgi:hypothetical protein